MPLRHFFLLLLAAIGLLPFSSPHAERLPVVRLQIGKHFIQAETAATPESRRQGLMHRTQLAKNQGMLFVFQRPQVQAMWMRNTPLPLSVAFIDEQGVIVNVAEMQPLDDTAHASTGPVKYALEMNGGWFLKHAVKPGNRVKGLPR